MKMRIASLSLLTVCYLTLVVAPAMAGTTTYSNPGPAALTTDAWTINFGFEVSDSFTMAGSSITGLSIIYWDASSTDLLTTADLALGTTPFGGGAGTTVAFTSTFLGINAYGYNLYQADAPGLNIPWVGGGGFATLGNACSTSGCSVITPIYWDESKGSSTAYENTIGSIPSESFTLFDPPSSGTPGTTPEPSSIMLFGSGILGLAGVLRRKSKG
jgi:hypothetical protein